MRRILSVVLAPLVALSLASGPAAAQDGGDTAAVAVNTRDGSSIFRLAFQIKRVAGEVVDSTNAAVAYASCSSCQTVAVSIQVVLATGDPSVVEPDNLAIAVNENCELCNTLASAYQFVFGTGGPVHFSAEGNQELARIRRELQRLRHSDLPIEEIQAIVEQLAARVNKVVETELSSGPPPGPGPATTTTRAVEEGGGGSTDTTATPSAPTTTSRPQVVTTSPPTTTGEDVSDTPPTT